ncbi:MAG: hypothetical protein AUJ55_09270 [Proteobacteria bacterium CG1_02_64_396]|nr:MAG: hypothetical protein AUJ55_09270 [Proteobacteria bacterium CG1_02_64_396]
MAPEGQLVFTVGYLFDAPVDRVFAAWTDPAAVPAWWGPAYLTTTVETMEVRPGGQWSIEQRDPRGGIHRFRGVYHTVAPPHLLVSTFEYGGAPDHVALDTHRFEAVGHQTRYIGHTAFQALANRDAMLATNCEPGVRETMERMAALLRRSS